MIGRLRFSFGYALRNIIRDRQRTAFALLSIAAGVATVVALRMLGLMLTDALTSNAQGIMRADVTVTVTNNSPRISILQSDTRAIPFPAAKIPQIDNAPKPHRADITNSLPTTVTQGAWRREDFPGSLSLLF